MIPSTAETLVTAARARFRVQPIPHQGRPWTEPSEVMLPGQASRFQKAGARFSPVFPVAKRPAEVAYPLTADRSFRLAGPTGLALEVTLRGAQPVAAEVGGGYVVYRGAHPGGGDVFHRAIPQGTEDFIVLADPGSPVATYDVELNEKVAGLRLVAGTLEFLDAKGAPRLRADPPYAVDGRGVRSDLAYQVTGCAVDRNPAAPWGRRVTPPGARRCSVSVHVPPAGLQFPVLLDPAWTTTDSIPIGGSRVGLMGHVAVKVGPTTILVAGGSGDPSCSTARTLLLDYSAMPPSWAAASFMSMSRYKPMAALVGNQVLVAGGAPGHPGDQTTATAELYNLTGPNAGAWEPAQNTMSVGRHSAATHVFDDGTVLIAGGLTTDVSHSTFPVESVDLFSGGTFTSNPAWNMTGPRLSHTLSRLDADRVMVTGGSTAIGPEALDNVEIFDKSNHTWTTDDHMIQDRRDHAQVTLPDGKILVMGGRRDVTLAASDTVELYDPNALAGQRWTLQTAMSTPRIFLGAAVLGSGKVLAVSGTSTVSLASAELFDPTAGATGTWTSAGSASVARGLDFTVTGPLSGGQVIVVGGDDGTFTPLPDVDVFTALEANGAACSDGTTCDSGFCVDGVCCDTACSGGTGDCQACSVAAGAAVDGTCGPRPNGMLCRASQGTCDPAEVCDGTHTTCPGDSRSNRLCREASGPCDVPEYCAGGIDCPTNAFVAQGTVCRAATGVCDAAEVCSGAAAACPADALQPAGTVCLAAAGDCDAAEVCSGTTITCPADTKSTGVCRPAASVCDKAESCDGTSNDCPANLVAAAGTPCRPTAGDCDVAEACDGVAALCPTDGFRAAGTMCRATAGVCDLAEACTGTSGTCPPDSKSMAVCKPATGLCEVGVMCDGIANGCAGAPKPAPAGTKCGSDGTCDDARGCVRDCALTPGSPQSQTCTKTGVTITVPAGTTGRLNGAAVTEVSVTERPDQPPFTNLVDPSGYASPLYHLAPSGATFDPPLSFTFVYRDDGSMRTPVVYLCRDDVTQCEVLTGSVGKNAGGENTITVSIAHFSTAFVALVATPPDGGVAGDAAAPTDAAGGTTDGAAATDAGLAPDAAATPDTGVGPGDASVADTAAPLPDAAPSPSDAAKASGDSSGCSCALGATAPGGTVYPGALAIGLALLLRRRRRPRR